MPVIRRLSAWLLAAWLGVMPLFPAAIPWIVRSGQSLSTGAVGYCGGGSPPCSTGSTYGNVMLYPSDGRYPFRDTVFSTLMPHVYNGLVPPNRESSATSMMNQYSA